MQLMVSADAAAATLIKDGYEPETEIKTSRYPLFFRPNHESFRKCMPSSLTDNGNQNDVVGFFISSKFKG